MKTTLLGAAAVLVAACGSTPEERAAHDEMMLERCAELYREIQEAEDKVSEAYARNNYEATCLPREQSLPDDEVPTRN